MLNEPRAGEPGYLILHNHPEGLVLAQSTRESLFSLGTLIDIRECALHSIQPEFFKRYSYRPLVILAWGMADRYGEAAEASIEVVEVKSYGEAHNYCRHLRPHPEVVDALDEEGNKIGEFSVMRWRRATFGLSPDLPAGA